LDICTLPVSRSDRRASCYGFAPHCSAPASTAICHRAVARSQGEKISSSFWADRHRPWLAIAGATPQTVSDAKASVSLHWGIGQLFEGRLTSGGRNPTVSGTMFVAYPPMLRLCHLLCSLQAAARPISGESGSPHVPHVMMSGLVLHCCYMLMVPGRHVNTPIARAALVSGAVRNKEELPCGLNST
jgi:hypothetical protein